MTTDLAIRLTGIYTEGHTDCYGAPAILHAIRTAARCETEFQARCALLHCAVNDGHLLPGDAELFAVGSEPEWAVIRALGYDAGDPDHFALLRAYSDPHMREVLVAISRHHLAVREEEGIALILDHVGRPCPDAAELDRLNAYVQRVRACRRALEGDDNPAVEDE